MVYVAYRRGHSYRRAREFFLAGVTPEIKTPLASLGLHAETIARPWIRKRGRSRFREFSTAMT